MSDFDSMTIWGTPERKFCPKCKEYKNFDCFGKIKGKIRSYCRKCHLAANFIPDERSHKKCSCCQLIKAVGDFNRLGNRYQSVCRDCQNTRDSRNRDQDKETGENVRKNRADYWKRSKWIKLKTKYVVSQSQYELLLSVQEHKCAICKEPEREIDKQRGEPLHLSVDHNHKTGRIRGLLCRRCNIGIGRLREDYVILQNAIDYLKKYS